MILELRDEWINRLLDDDTIQGVGQLHISIDSDNAYCCWGLLLDSMERRGLVARTWRETTPDRFEFGYIDLDGNVAWKYPTDRMLELAGIKWDDGDTGHIVSRLSGLNDNGSNFAYIASEIRENL